MWRKLVPFFLMPIDGQSGGGEGRLIKEAVASQFFKGSRTVRIYLPSSYYRETKRRYPVLYLHDGQNVFSSAGPDVAFGWGNWEVDKTADELCRAGKMQEAILVAVDHGASRYSEYCGRHHAATRTKLTNFEKYAAFLIQELKPKIDAEYRTQPGPASTGVMGSSMGGICSMVLAWEWPEVFGRAASLSGAFQVERAHFLNGVLRQYQGKPKPTRLYLDSGVVDYSGGDDGQEFTAAVAKEFRCIGWGKSLMYHVDSQPLTVPELEKTGLRRDKWAEAQTSQHNEFYWRLRVWRPLTFLFPPEE